MEIRHLPTRNSLTSFWLRQALEQERPEPRVLDEHVRTDVVIVGGGFTGLWTAIELKQRDPALAVTVVEAGLCGSGASGTNAGYLMNLWPKFGLLASVVGQDEARRLAVASSQAIDDIVTFCGEHDIDPHLRPQGWLWSATSPAQLGAWEDTLSGLEGVAENPMVALSADDAIRLGGQGVVGGVLDPTCATVQPALLARGLRRAAGSLGVEIYENSPMREIVDGPGGVVVTTPQGRVQADRAVLAVNAWAIGLPTFSRSLVMTISQNAVTDVLGAARLDSLLTQGVGVSDSRDLLNYWRTTPDERLLFGKGGAGVGFGRRSASTTFHPIRRLAMLERHYRASFPAADAPLVETWQAPVEYSLSSLPFFTSLAGSERVFVGTGYSGDGIGPSRVGAKILASLATGVRDEWSTGGLTTQPSKLLPPEPARFLGGYVVRRAVSRRDDLLTAGRRVGPVTDAVTRLNPATWL